GHTKEKPYFCAICPRTFAQPSALNGHVQRAHTLPSFECLFCNKMFSSFTGLDNHTRVHSGEKPYSCSICDCTFALPETACSVRRGLLATETWKGTFVDIFKNDRTHATCAKNRMGYPIHSGSTSKTFIKTNAKFLQSLFDL
ncbi:Zinc finger and SCAN domain-containing protein 31, partial [Orchesella cincta]